jgi:hypothetical protein
MNTVSDKGNFHQLGFSFILLKGPVMKIQQNQRIS